MAITFDPTVGSRLNFFTSLRKPFSLGLLWNRNSVTRRSGRLDLSNGQNGHNFRSDRWITFKFLHQFLKAVFVWVAMESLLGNVEVQSTRLD